MRSIHSILITLTLTFSLHTSAKSIPPILVMDTIEFNTIQHKLGKEKYITELREILKRMRLKTADFDAMGPDNLSDENVITALIESHQRWVPISNEIEKLCRKKEHHRNCNAMAKLRLDIFDFIKKNPQDYSPEGESEANATR
jgi:hypothetical protein